MIRAESRHLIQSFKDSLSHKGACLVSDENLFLAADQWKTLNYKANRLKYERYEKEESSSHAFKMSPVKEHTKETVIDKVIFDVVNSIQVRSLVNDILALSHFNVHRCECHIYEEGDFISLEWMQKAIKDHSYFLAFSLEGKYTGGEHLVRQGQGGVETYRPQSGEILVSSCDFDHEVLPVTSGRHHAVLAFIQPF